VNRACPLCSEVHAVNIAALDYAMWDDLAIDAHALLVSCVECGMVYHQTVASESDFAQYYKHNSYYATAETGGAGGFSADEISRYQRTYSIVSKYLNNKNPSIVDVGAGQGGFLSWCKDQGLHHLTAIEKSGSCSKFIKNNLQTPVYNDVVDFAVGNKQAIDVIIISHMLEHAFNPSHLLAQLIDVTDENTLFYFEVPNAAFYVAEENPWQYLYFEHINHFDSIHLEMLLNDLGLGALFKVESSFIPEKGNDQECCVIVAKKVMRKRLEHSYTLALLMQVNLKYPSSILSYLELNLDDSAKKISIWGISQYSQFLIAKSPFLLKQLRFLIDKSPAKCDRYLRSHKVEGVDKILELGSDDILLIPKNIISKEMKASLDNMKFSGEIILF